MTCPRCAGLLVGDEMVDAVWGDSCQGVRCLNCGYVGDGVMAGHRVRPPAATDGRTLPRMVGSSRFVRAAGAIE